MPKLSLSVRVAAASIVCLSVIHIIFWAWLALAARSADSTEFPYNYLFGALCVFSATGLPGIVVGAGLGVLLGSALQMLLFNVKPWDPLVLGGTMSVLAGAGLLATLIPGLRAASVDPLVALRHN